jgi:glycosyltransferase involved in cell wall biosynthesis
MRVLYFSRDYTPHDHRFLSALAGSPHQTGYLRLEDCGSSRETRPIPKGVEVLLWAGGRRPEKGWSFLSLLPDFRRVIRVWKPDVIHAGPLPDVAFLAAICGFRPLVSMSWGYDILHDVHQDWLKSWAARLTLKRTTILFADCQAVASAAAGLGMDASRIVIFPWGVNLATFTPRPQGLFPNQTALRKRLGWTNDEFVLLSTRSLAPLYGIREVAQAFTRAAAHIPVLRLLILGGGPLEAELRSLFQARHLMERVVFGGQIPNPELPEYYRAADLYISASHTDGSSISLLEALACGCPALVSDIPGNTEWVREEGEGWLFRTGDAQMLEQAMMIAFERRDLLIEMGMNARCTAACRARCSCPSKAGQCWAGSSSVCAGRRVSMRPS